MSEYQIQFGNVTLDVSEDIRIKMLKGNWKYILEPKGDVGLRERCGSLEEMRAGALNVNKFTH